MTPNRDASPVTEQEAEATKERIPLPVLIEKGRGSDILIRKKMRENEGAALRKTYLLNWKSYANFDYWVADPGPIE
jgi:hypothetical protein